MARAMAQATADGHGSEWQTWLLILAVYGSWLGLVLAYPVLPGWLVTPLLWSSQHGS
jgi:hypothetical protein